MVIPDLQWVTQETAARRLLVAIHTVTAVDRTEKWCTMADVARLAAFGLRRPSLTVDGTTMGVPGQLRISVCDWSGGEHAWFWLDFGGSTRWTKLRKYC